MAICEHCKQEMEKGVSCILNPIEIEGVDFQPVPYGKETRFLETPSRSTCHDCAVPLGGFHHPGCDMEECPKCHGQVIGCDCGDEEEYDGTQED